MADGRHILNRQFEIFPQPFNRRDEILHEHAYCRCKQCEMLKWKLNIRYISATVHPIKTKFCTTMQIGAANNGKC